MIVPEALWLLAARRRQRSVQVAVGLVALCGLALIPLALGQNSTGNTKWIAPIPLGSRLGQVIPQFLVGFQTPAQSVLEPLAAALALGALVLLALRSDAPALRRAVALGAVAVGGLLLNLVLIAVGFDDLITRNLIALWVPAALVVAAGFGARWAGRLGVAGAVAMCAIGVTAAIGVATNRAFQRPDWRVVAHMLGSAPASGRVILIQHNRDLLPLSLYEHGLRFMGGSHAHVTELDVVAIGAPRVHAVLVGRGLQSVAIDAAALVSAARLSSGVAQARAAVHGARPAGLEARAGRPADRFAGAYGDDASARRSLDPALAVADCRAATSASLSRRCAPERKSPSSSGPIAILASERTG